MLLLIPTVSEEIDLGAKRNSLLRMVSYWKDAHSWFWSALWKTIHKGSSCASLWSSYTTFNNFESIPKRKVEPFSCPDVMFKVSFALMWWVSSRRKPSTWLSPRARSEARIKEWDCQGDELNSYFHLSLGYSFMQLIRYLNVEN